jgi:tetratricopeptide (TPR) repeat protein
VGEQTIKEIADGLQATPLGEMSGLVPGTRRADSAITEGRHDSLERSITEGRHDSLERSITWSYNLLGEKSGPSMQLLFAACSLFAGPFDAATLAAIATSPTAKTDLIRLHQISLVRRVKRNDATCYQLHRFTHDYARERFVDFPETETDAIKQRFIAHYVKLVRDTLDLNDLTSHTLLHNEWRNVTAAAELAKVSNDYSAVIDLSAVSGFLVMEGLWTEGENLTRAAVATAVATGHRRNEGMALNNLGIVYQAQRRWEEAIKVYRRALVIFRELKDRIGGGRTLNNLGIVYSDQRRWKKAIEAYNDALVIKHATNDRIGEAQTLQNLGNVYWAQGQGHWKEAIKVYRRALVIKRELKDRIGEGKTLINIALLWEARGAIGEALTYAQQAAAVLEGTQAQEALAAAQKALARLEAQ